MKKALFFIFLLVSFAHCAFAQNTFVNKQYGFAMQEPKNWILSSKVAINDNLTKFELDDAVLAKLLKDSNGTILLAAYRKYDPVLKEVGLIPTIQIHIRSKSPSTFKEFEKQLIQSAEGFKNVFDQYEAIGEPQEVKISGIQSLLIVGKFIMKMKDGQIFKVRSRTYAIPLGTYFFQLNFSDGYEEEDCSLEFDNLVKTIKIGRPTNNN